MKYIDLTPPQDQNCAIPHINRDNSGGGTAEMNFVDIDVKCIQCGVEFVFSAGEQEFFHAKGFAHQPKTCRVCRSKKKHSRFSNDFAVKCADCGAATTVPFMPRQHRPVYCRACFSEHKSLQPA